MFPYINQKANIAECFEYFFLLVHTYSSEIITAKKQKDLDIGINRIFLKAQMHSYCKTFLHFSLFLHIGGALYRMILMIS